MSGWVELGDGMAGFAVGLFLHAIPASWWPRWLGKLVVRSDKLGSGRLGAPG
jgi:hypothetical protein